MIMRQSLLGSYIPPAFDPRQDQTGLDCFPPADVVEKQNT